MNLFVLLFEYSKFINALNNIAKDLSISFELINEGKTSLIFKKYSIAVECHIIAEDTNKIVASSL